MPRQIQRATEIKYDLVPYPLLGTPKFDGIHLHNDGKSFYSRNGIEVPNKSVKEKLADAADYLNKAGVAAEFEFLVEGRTFNELSGDYRSFDTDVQKVKLVGLDVFNDKFATYRYKTLARVCSELAELRLPNLTIDWVVPTLIKTPAEAREFTASCLKSYEGAVFRGVSSYYKLGVSTLAEASFLRDKGEAHYNGEVVSFNQSRDKYGALLNMSHSANVWCEELKVFVVVSMTKNLVDSDREDFMVNPSLYIGKTLEFMCNFTEGMQVRSARFKRWRNDL